MTGFVVPRGTTYSESPTLVPGGAFTVTLLPRTWKYLTEPHEALYNLGIPKPFELENALALEPDIASFMRGNLREAETLYGLPGSVAPVPEDVEKSVLRYGDPNLYERTKGGLRWRSESFPREFLEAWEAVLAKVASRHPEAARELFDFAARYPYNPEVLAAAAEAAMERHGEEQAYALCTRLVSLQPFHASAWMRLGNLYLRRNAHDDAAACLAVARRLDPRSPILAYNLGNVRMEQKRLAEAAALYEEALALGGVSAHYHYNLAAAKEALGEREAALASYRRALIRWSGAREFRDFLAANILRLEHETAKR